MKTNELLAWVDIETTGLDIRSDSLLEVACIITDQQLNKIARESWTLRFDPSYNDLNRIPEIVMDMHERSGLWAACRQASLDAFTFEKEFIRFLDFYLGKNPPFEKYVMAGSGVARFDYTWFQINHPEILRYFAYYTLDTGVVRRALELAGIISIRDDEKAPVRDSLSHRALDDIDDHLEEWKYYLSYLKFTGQPLMDWEPNAWRFDMHDDSP